MIVVTDMEKLFAVLSMYTVLGAVMCAPLPGIEPSPSVGEVSERIFVHFMLLYSYITRSRISRKR